MERIELLPLVFDKMSGKSGVVLPLDEQTPLGIFRTFYDDKEMPLNNWQFFDDLEFEHIGTIPLSDPFTLQIIIELLKRSPDDTPMHDYYRANGVEVSL